MGIQLAPIEGTPYAGGTATGIIYLDANGLQRTSSPGPTVDASGNVAVSGDINVGSNKSVYIAGIQGAYDIGAGGAKFKTNLTYDAILEGVKNVHLSPGALGGSGTYAEINNGTEGVLRDLKARTVYATAQAITDTPLVVEGAVGQTADLATIGGVTIDASSNVTVSDQATFEGKVTINGAGSEIFSAYDLGSFSVFNFGGGTYSNHTTRLTLHAGYTNFEHAAGASELRIKTLGGLEFWNTGIVQFFAADGSTPGAIETGQLTVSSPTVPATASATGVTGTVAWDADYVYICTATDTWKRVAISTW
jgi:hypothetical protein